MNFLPWLNRSLTRITQLSAELQLVELSLNKNAANALRNSG